jgi:tetratricopeptide (TPR) repeat protein
VLALTGLAGWYRGQKKYAEAEKTYQRVLKLQTDHLGRHHDVALAHNDLAVIYTEWGNFPEAERHFKEALELWRTRWDMPMRTEDEAVTLHNYSALLEKTGRSAEAKEMEAKADAIMEERKKALGF